MLWLALQGFALNLILVLGFAWVLENGVDNMFQTPIHFQEIIIYISVENSIINELQTKAF